GWRTALVVDDLEHELAVRGDYSAEIREIETLSTLRDELAEEVAHERHLQRAVAGLEPPALASYGIESDAAEAMLDGSVAAARARFDRLRRPANEVITLLVTRARDLDAAFNPY